MHKKILVAYDGSMLSRKAIEIAKSYASQNESLEVHVISVLEATGPRTNLQMTRNIMRELTDKLQPQMDKIADEFAREGITIKDRKSTRLNSSHVAISYAVFCLKKKRKNN